MGIADTGLLGANFIMKFKVDTSEARQALKDLTGEEKKAAQAALQLQEAKNKQMDRWSKGIALVSTGMQMSTKAIQLAGDSWKAYEKAALAAGGADAEKAKSFRNALGQMDGAMERFKVSIGSMVASLAPLVTALSAVVDVAGGVVGIAGKIAGGLLGGGGTDFFNQSMTGDAGAQYADFQEAQARRRMTEIWKNQQALKNLVNPYATGSGLDATGNADAASQARINAWGKKLQADIEKKNEAARRMWEGFDTADVVAIYAASVGGVPISPDAVEAVGKRKGGGKGGGGFDISSSERGGLSMFSDDDRRAFAAYFDSFESRLRGPDVGTGDPDFGYASDQLKGALAAIEQVQKDEKRDLLKSLFGDFDEYDAYAEKMTMLADTVNAVTGAAQSSFDAWVDGSSTAKEAIKDFFASALRGIASNMFAKALEHGAMAIGSLALQDYRGAALHGKAAALHAAGAIAVGGLARVAFGGGGSGGGNAYGGGAPSVGGGSRPTGGGSERPVVIILGDSMANDSPAMRAKEVGRALNRADRYRDGTVEWS